MQCQQVLAEPIPHEISLVLAVVLPAIDLDRQERLWKGYVNAKPPPRDAWRVLQRSARLVFQHRPELRLQAR